MKKILIVDDEVNIGLLLSKFLTRNSFDVSSATSGNSAMEYLAKDHYDLVLCDYRLEDTDGKEMLIKIKESYPKTGVIIITGYSDIKLAVELIKLGAYDYITKPLYPDEILNTINKAIETQIALNASLPETESPQEQEKTKATKNTYILTDEFVIGQSGASKELMKQILLVAPTAYSVILMGDSGTGKESVAKAIHLNSPRKDKPFVAMDCGSLTKELAGSEFLDMKKVLSLVPCTLKLVTLKWLMAERYFWTKWETFPTTFKRHSLGPYKKEKSNALAAPKKLTWM